MSAFQKSFLSCKLPPKSAMATGRGNLSGKSKGMRGRADYSADTWKKYFSEKKDVEVDGNTFRVYKKGDSGPCLVLIHGGGFSALTWSLLTTTLYDMVECQVLALDLRSHGDTFTKDDTDLSIETLTNDVVSVINEVVSEGTPLILVGHSLGGSVAVHVGHHPGIHSIVGLIVIDVVEGTALGALSSMQSILRGRPQYFNSIEDAIKWSVQSGQVKNLESAKVSMPGQIKNIQTGKPATVELEEGDSDGVNHQEKQTLEPVGRSVPVTSVESISEEEETQFKSPDEVKGSYGWRIDLRATEIHWSGWFQGLSKQFLSCPAQKLLLLASLDRMDTDLTVAQMQGKFEIHAFEQSRGRCGHTVHEDIPDAVAEVIATYLVRNKFCTQKANFQEGSMPCC
uniref:Protein phosphatase methylesterase 1 n=1 Tax=Lygus hesperus TaxID=30085 RepID=A0A0A9YJP2_LYGHE